MKRQEQMEGYLASLPDSLILSPQKTQAMWQEFVGLNFSGSTPNHILVRPMPRLWQEKRYKTVPDSTSGAGYHSLSANQEFASATALRQNLDQPDFLKIHPSPSLD